MIHRYWCGRCRNVTTETNSSPQPLSLSHTCPKCNSIANYLESVAEPVDLTEENTEPTVDKPRKPPSRQEWYDAGYAPGTYERRFAGPEWLPCWSDVDEGS